MYAFLEKNKICSNQITELHEYIQQEEFDTDSVQIDVEINGNIVFNIQDEKFIILLQQFVQSHTSMFIQCIECCYSSNSYRFS